MLRWDPTKIYRATFLLRASLFGAIVCAALGNLLARAALRCRTWQGEASSPDAPSQKVRQGEVEIVVGKPAREGSTVRSDCDAPRWLLRSLVARFWSVPCARRCARCGARSCAPASAGSRAGCLTS